jgi:hypothetical protein
MRVDFTSLFKPFYLSGTMYLLLTLLLISTSSQGAPKSNIRGERYCEVILAKTLTHFSVYTTWGLNDCSDQRWNKVTVTKVKQESRASFVFLNGPRFWVIDEVQHPNLVKATIQKINELSMREVGVLHIRLADVFKSNAPYYKHEVQRQTTSIYQPGKPIYELLAPSGEVFVMQSYSIQKLPQTEHTLYQLSTKLRLPKGWVFKTGTIKKTESIQAVNNLAIIIQDDFDNTYQKATHDFL